MKKIQYNGSVGRELAEGAYKFLSRKDFFMDEIDLREIDDARCGQMVLMWHRLLQPVWRKICDSMYDFKYNVVPNRTSLSNLKKKITNGYPSPIAEFIDLLDPSIMDQEEFYNINISVTFGARKINVYKRHLSLVFSFIDLLSDIPPDIFEKCRHCGKCIVITRKGRKYCKGCAAKKYQKEHWNNQPDVMKAKENKRYADKRKGNRNQSHVCEK